MGAAGVEPANLPVQEPKSCVYANFTTRPSMGDTLPNFPRKNKGEGRANAHPCLFRRKTVYWDAFFEE